MRWTASHYTISIAISCHYILQLVCNSLFFLCTDFYKFPHTYRRPEAAACAISVFAACCVSKRICVSFIQSWATRLDAPFNRFMYRNVMLKSPLSIQYLKYEMNDIHDTKQTKMIIHFFFHQKVMKVNYDSSESLPVFMISVHILSKSQN